MTRDIRDRILKDVNGNISDHLRSHIHLTNCIHLKNHMHRHSPVLSDRALMRELAVLQKSRSLRDPSASPRSWHSPDLVDSLINRGERDGLVNGRRSVGIDRSKRSLWISGNSPPASGGPISGHNRKIKKEESSGRSIGIGASWRNDDRPQDVVAGCDDVGHDNGRHHSHMDKIGEEKICVNGNNPCRARRRKFRGAKRNRPTIVTRDAETHNEMSAASNSFGQGRAEGVNEYNDRHVNGCGVPWNWSRIHHRGKSIIDMAGQSLSCGLSESKLKQGGGSISRRKDIPDRSVMSEQSSLSTKSYAEALPLLFDGSGSQGSIDFGNWRHDYSGELGIYADNLLKQETDTNLASEGRSHQKHKSHRHQNFIQKYAPRTFRDLVGQNLVVQALSNAISKKKVGLLYVFYGPHGTGKTSCARIFASGLNCQSLEHPKPCGHCNSCIAHDTGKSRFLKEVGPVGNFDFENIIELLDDITISRSQYRVFIFDECDTLSSDCWSAILKIIDRAPRCVVFVLVCSGIDVLPHIIISRCQKFFFPKLKDADVIYTLQWIATNENLEIDKDALKLIASRSDGSLRDAAMTLEQLSLLGQRISLGLVQELVGLISDEKLVDLLDLALSANTVNTVKNLRDIMESGVEPLVLMSQLATVITDILAGSYDFLKEKHRRKFFRRQALSKEDMEKLRQALKTLSEEEKQLRVSNDRITWLTAALLRLAPDHQYMLPSSNADTSYNHSPLLLQNDVIREKPRKSNAESSRDAYEKGHIGGGTVSHVYGSSNDKNHKFHHGIEEIWLSVLEKIPHNSIKEFMYKEGNLISLNYGAAPTVQLVFNSELSKSKAEKVRSYIVQAFESVLKFPVTIEIRCESRNLGAGQILLPVSQDSSRLDPNRVSLTSNDMPPTSHNDVRRVQHKHSTSAGVNRSEIVASPRENIPAQKKSAMTSFPDEKISNDRNPSRSIVRSKVSLAHVIQHGQECSEQSGWSKRKAVSIAEKLEQENLRLEPKSRGLLCWKPPRVTRRKVSRLKIRTRKPQTLLKFVSCGGRCLSGRSPK